MKKLVIGLSVAAGLSFFATQAFAAAHAMPQSVTAMNQDVSGGTVSAEAITADANGWMVVHRTGADMKPGVVIGYAPIRKGMNSDVTAILQQTVNSGDMLMLMVHSEAGGMRTGVFEYTLGAKEDGPIRVDGNLVMKVITAE